MTMGIMDNVKVSEQEGVITLELSGDFVEKNFVGIRTMIENALMGPTPGFVFIFEKVDFVDSSGVRMLLELKKLVEGNKRKMILSTLPPPIQTAFERMQMENVFNITKTLDKAIERAKAK